MQRLVCFLLLAVLGLGLPGYAEADEAAAAKLEATSRAFVEVVVDPEEVVVGQVFLVRIRLGIDAAFFEAHGVAQFRQPMDVPLQVRAPWLRRVEGLNPVETQDGRATPLDVDDETRAFALGDAVVRGALVEGTSRQGRSFEVIEVVRAFTAERAGTFPLDAPEIRFAYATAFEEDFLDERRPLDRHRAVIKGAGARVVVRAPGSGGTNASPQAVGAFALAMQVSRTEVLEGDVIDVSVAIVGKGNPGDGLPPRPAPWTQSFDIIGHRLERRPGRQIHHYELAPRGTGKVELAPLEFAFLDPGPPSRRRAETTRAVTIDVARAQVPGAIETPRAPDVPVTPIPVPGTHDAVRDAGSPGSIPADDTTAPAETLTTWSRVLPWLTLALLLGLLTWFAVWRMRRDDLADGELASISASPRTRPVALGPLAEALRAASETGGVDRVAPALAEYLAARLRCRPGEVYDIDLKAKMTSVGMGTTAQEAAVSCSRRRTAARYGPLKAPASLDDDVAAILRDTPVS